jgi:hypothetical protein
MALLWLWHNTMAGQGHNSAAGEIGGDCTVRHWSLFDPQIRKRPSWRLTRVAVFWSTCWRTHATHAQCFHKLQSCCDGQAVGQLHSVAFWCPRPLVAWIHVLDYKNEVAHNTLLLTDVLPCRPPRCADPAGWQPGAYDYHRHIHCCYAVSCACTAAADSLG